MDNIISELRPIPDPNLTYDNALAYTEAVKVRSKLVEEWIGINLATECDVQIGDVAVDEFLQNNGLDKINTNLTPDVMFIKSGNLYIGDISVTQSLFSAQGRKADKYEEMRRKIALKNPFTVVQRLDFILEEKASNLNDIEAKMLPFCKTPFTGTEALIRGLQAIFTYRDSIIKNVKDIETFNREVDVLMKVDKIELLDSSGIEVPAYQPLHTEKELAFQIFKHIEDNPLKMDTMTEKFDVKSILSKIKGNNDQNYDERNPGVSIPYVFNCDIPFTDKSEKNISQYDYLREIIKDLTFNLGEQSQIIELLPCIAQIETLEKINELKTEKRTNLVSENTDRTKFLENLKDTFGQTSEYYCPEARLARIKDGYLYKVFIEQSGKINSKKTPSSIRSHKWHDLESKCESKIKYLSEDCESEATNLTFDLPTDPIRLAREEMNVSECKEWLSKINKKRGSVLLSSIRKFVNDAARIPKHVRKGVYYSMPVQKNMIIGILTNNNLGGVNPHYNFFSITRFTKEQFDKNDPINLFANNITKVETTNEYVYIVSKLHKYTFEKLSKLHNVDREFRTHAISMISLLSIHNANELTQYLNRYIGAISLILTDLHQKPSIILDLMKYIVSMPSCDKCSIEDLLIDKLDIMYKTELDIWLVHNIFKFLSKNILLHNTVKPQKMTLVQTGKKLDRSIDSFNIKGKFALFFDNNLVTDSLLTYLSESQLLFHARPKKLYNSQFIDEACLKVVENNKLYMIEKESFEQYATGEKTDITQVFPFEANFCFDRDALFYAQSDCNKEANMIRHIAKIKNQIKAKLLDFSINNLSMRGACRLPEEVRWTESSKMKYNIDNKGGKERVHIERPQRSTTAINAGLQQLKDIIHEDRSEDARVFNLAYKNTEREMYYNMSEKEQRGGGRPIGSADFYTKQKLRSIEDTFKVISQYQEENLLARGINRSAKIASLVTQNVKDMKSRNMSHLVHVVMDQSQFSEGDNTIKFEAVIQDCLFIPSEIKGDLINFMKQMRDRNQYFPRVPSKIIEDHDLAQYIITESANLSGVKGKIGWVQGMLNIISTYVHIIAVKWLSKIFMKYYSEYYNSSTTSKQLVSHLVNSDDSYAVIITNDKEMTDKFYQFFVAGKKMFALRQNKKKSYTSLVIGEIIQKYVAHGNVVNIWPKDAVSVFNNNMGYDLYKDSLSSTGTIQTLVRNGCPENVACYVKNELRMQIEELYNMSRGRMNDMDRIQLNRARIPVELGGWPKEITTFELAMAGSYAQLEYSLECIRNSNRNTNELKLMIASMIINSVLLEDEEKIKVFNDDSIVLNLQSANKEILFKSINNYVRQFNDSPNVLDEDMGNQGIDMLYNNDIIELATISTEELMADSNYTKNYLNPFTFIIPYNRKVIETLNTMKSFNYQPSEVYGLMRIRTSIRQAVADLRRNTNELVLSLSESGFTKDLRKTLAANSAIASYKCMSIVGMKSRMTIIKSYQAVIELYNKLADNIKSTFHDILPIILTDPTEKAKIAISVIRQTKIKGSVRVRNIIANEIPKTLDDLSLSNDMAMVLTEIVSPGFCTSQGMTFNSNIMLSSDIDNVKRHYGRWLENSSNKLMCCKAIYYHYLNIRKQRWLIGPHMATRSLTSFIRGCYLSVRNGIDQYTSEIGPLHQREMKNALQLDNDITIMTAWELSRCIKDEGSLPFDPIKDWCNIFDKIDINFKSEFVKLNDALGSDVISREIYNTLSDEEKKYWAAMVFLNNNTKTILLSESARSSDYVIKWNKEQRKVTNTAGIGRWIGDFSVVISKGRFAVILEGEPGSMKKITANTNNCRVIVDLLYHFLRKNNFTNYSPPTSILDWRMGGFFNKPENYITPGYYFCHNTDTLPTIEKIDSTSILLVKNNMTPITIDLSLIPESSPTVNFLNFSLDYRGRSWYLDGVGVTVEGILRGEQEERSPIMRMKDRSDKFDGNLIRIREARLDNISLTIANDLGILRSVIRRDHHQIPQNLLIELMKQNYGASLFLSNLVKKIITIVEDDNIKFTEVAPITSINVEVKQEIAFDYTEDDLGLDQFDDDEDNLLINIVKNIPYTLSEYIKGSNLRYTNEMFTILIFNTSLASIIKDTIRNINEIGYSPDDAVDEVCNYITETVYMLKDKIESNSLKGREKTSAKSVIRSFNKVITGLVEVGILMDDMVFSKPSQKLIKNIYNNMPLDTDISDNTYVISLIKNFQSNKYDDNEFKISSDDLFSYIVEEMDLE